MEPAVLRHLERQAGLRIEARYLPAGPSIIDEMANAAFLIGLLIHMPKEFGDIKQYMSFDDAKSNFFNAARYGLNGQIRGPTERVAESGD